MAEWLNAPVLKTGVLERVSGVRIPLSPPFEFRAFLKIEVNNENQKPKALRAYGFASRPASLGISHGQRSDLSFG